MGSVIPLLKAGAAGQGTAQHSSDQTETARPRSDGSVMPLEGSISIAGALGSIMLSLGVDRTWTHGLRG